MDDVKSLLLVDDDVNDIELFLRAMERIGMQDSVVTAHDGVEALEYLARQSAATLPKLLVIDFKMPRMDGLHLVEKMQENANYRWIPKVILTSSQAREDVSRAYAVGANAYLLKPVSFTQFNQDVETLAKFWLGMNLVDQSNGKTL